MYKNIIILEKDGKKETWGALTDICKVHSEITFGSIKDKKFPFNYKGFEFTKVPYKTKLI